MPQAKNDTSDARKHRDPLFENWNSGDVKLLTMTIVATVTANIITVILIALTIIVARSMRPHPGTPGNYAFLFGSSMIPLMAVWTVLYFWRISRREKASDLASQVIRWIMISVGIFEGLYLLLFVLALIGFATGIK
jgi:hypothetical protein